MILGAQRAKAFIFDHTQQRSKAVQLTKQIQKYKIIIFFVE